MSVFRSPHRKSKLRNTRNSKTGVSRIQRATYNTNNGRLERGSWYSILAILKERSGGICEAANCRNAASEAHHTTPVRSGGTNSLRNLIHLCKDCHNRRHNHLFRARANR